MYNQCIVHCPFLFSLNSLNCAKRNQLLQLMKKLLYFTLPFLLICLAIEGCKKNGEQNATDSADSTALRIALLPTVDCLPFYYAQATGIYDSLQLDVVLQTNASAIDADTAFLRGHVDGIVTDLVKANIWRSNGDSIRIVMSADLNLFLVTSKAARLFKTASIKEKIIGITRHSSVDFVTDKILESVKMGSEELNKPQINDLVLRGQMVNNNQYDGAVLPEPYASECVAKGNKRIDSAEKQKLSCMLSLVFADSIVVQRKEDIAKLIEGFNIAVERINSLQSSALQYLPDTMCVMVDDTLYDFKPLHPAYLPKDSILRLTTTWAKGRGLIKKECTYNDLVDSTFIRK